MYSIKTVYNQIIYIFFKPCLIFGIKLHFCRLGTVCQIAKLVVLGFAQRLLLLLFWQDFAFVFFVQSDVKNLP